ncbi:M23 family metallopeptidase [Naumannella halotolerans]|uniref:Murein DD-endopeptidase MepM/ murein hydrolase activator NlpD n=1 Tax=Naumannella halotolerans TaxID=993414 RepID=A0A4R7JA50_9ACTN|nr:M23 family metallopeptidase [Naumannella halotolerans]TDT34194.1 murein DD-endopeptidase MepM/ murein hydrolase activator NlpD [Naumannella halotolerans]
MTKNAWGFKKSRSGHTADDTSSIRTTVTQGIGALAISALGLAVAATITLNSTVNTVNASQTAVASEAGQPNSNRAEPAAGAEGTSSVDAEAAADAADSAENAEASAEDGDLEQFSRDREGRASRSTIRVALDTAVESEVAADRTESLDEVAENAGSESRKAVASARNEALEAEVEAARREEARAQEAKKKAEEEARQAEDSGTLQNQQNDTSAPTTSIASGEVSGEGGVSPIAKGSYRVGARWGAVGSWSRYHTGQDLPASVGTPIRAAVDGTVMPATGGGWAGTHVIIKAADGSSTLYAHMSSTSVSPGQSVKAGQNIGAVGMTGRTFGPHLHFEYYKAGVSPGDVYSSSDPYAWMLSKGVQL